MSAQEVDETYHFECNKWIVCQRQTTKRPLITSNVPELLEIIIVNAKLKKSPKQNLYPTFNIDSIF